MAGWRWKGSLHGLLEWMQKRMNLGAEAMSAESFRRKLRTVVSLVSVDTRAISTCLMLIGLMPSGQSDSGDSSERETEV